MPGQQIADDAPGAGSPARTPRGAAPYAAALVVVAAAGVGAQEDAGEPTERLGALAAEFAAGGTRVGSLREGTLGEGQEKRFGMQMEAGRCYVFLAAGDAVLTDLDMALEASGERLGADTESDNYPVVRACTPLRVRVEVALTAVRGAGRYAMALYEVPPDGDEAATLTAAAGGQDLGSRVRALAAERAPRTAIEGDVVRGRLVEDEVTALSRRLRGETCYTFVAAGGPGVEDLDLRVYVGQQKAGDDFGPESEAVVADFCPATDTAANIQIVMSRGSGDYGFGLFAREARGDELTEVSEIDTAGLTRRLLRVAASRAAGLSPARSPEFGTLRHGRSQTFTFPTERGMCYRVVGVAEATLSNLDLSLFVDDRPVGEDTEPDAMPVVGTCASAPGVGRVDVWAVEGSGGFAIGLYSGEHAASATPDATTASPLESLLDAAAAALSPGATRAAGPFLGTLAITGSQQYDVTLQPGQCYAFVGVCDAGNLDLEIAQGTILLGRDDDLDATPGVLYCATAAMTARAKLTLLSASGNFAFGVYIAPSVQGAATTQPRPTATGIAVGGTETDFIGNRIRELHRQYAAALLPVSSPQRGTLRQAESSEFLLTLPAGRCYTVIAVGMPSVRDLDISLTSPYGQVLATDTTDDANPVLVTNPCPQWSGDYRIKISMQYGYGQFGFQVFSQ